MGNSKEKKTDWLRIIEIAIATVACVAAIVVIPEVRERMGSKENEIQSTNTPENSKLEQEQGIPTVTPTTAPDLAPPYDDFNDEQYDNSFNSALWEQTGTQHVDIEQRNEVLVFSTNNFPDGGSVGMAPVDAGTWSLEKTSVIGAKLRLDSSRRGQGSFINISTYADLSGRDWWTECMLNNSESEHTLFFCDIHSGEQAENGEPIFEYQTRGINGNYDEWYTVKIIINPNTAEFSFYLNDKLLGSHTPEDAHLLKEASFYPRIGSWANSEDQFIGYFDDVRFGQ